VIGDPRIRFLVVDEQQSIRKLCAAVGASLDFHCLEAGSSEAALAMLEAEAPDVVLAEVVMSSSSAVEFLSAVRRLAPRAVTAIMSGRASMEMAVQAMRLGADDYLAKPFRVEELQLLLRGMGEKARLLAENQFLRERVRAAQGPAAVSWAATDLEQLERETIGRVLEQVQGDKARARNMLGISRATLYRKLKRYGIRLAARAAPAGRSQAEASARAPASRGQRRSGG